MQGVVSYLDTRKPTDEEMATARFCEVTSDAPWDPHSKKFAEKEQAVQSRVSRVSKGCNSKRTIHAAYLQKISQSRNLSVCSSSIDEVIINHMNPGARSFRKINSIHSLVGDRIMEPGESKSGELNEDQLLDKIFGRKESITKKPRITPEFLSKIWKISPRKATQTLKATTQRAVKAQGNKLVKRFKTKRWMNKKILKGKWYSDTMMFSVKGIIAREKAAQLFTNGKGFDKACPIEGVKQCSQALSGVVQEHGIPEWSVADLSLIHI